MEHVLEFAQSMSVEKVFEYLGKELRADSTMYGGSAGDARDAVGNTLFCVLWDGPNNSYNIAYVVNPHAGHFSTVDSSHRTNKITIQTRTKVAPELEAIHVAKLRGELARLI